MLTKRKPKKFGIREETRVRSPSHLRFVRSFCCIAMGRGEHQCSDRIEAHHVKESMDGGMGVKPSDEFAVPMCSLAHAELHLIGETTFATRYGVDPLAIAARLWRLSPAHKRMETDND